MPASESPWQPGAVLVGLLDQIGRRRDPEEERCLAVITSAFCVLPNVATGDLDGITVTVPE